MSGIEHGRRLKDVKNENEEKFIKNTRKKYNIHWPMLCERDE